VRQSAGKGFHNQTLEASHEARVREVKEPSKEACNYIQEDDSAPSCPLKCRATNTVLVTPEATEL
jgi:hypothetical protein